MFLLLLLVTLLVSLAACALVVRLFTRPIGTILNRLVGTDLSAAWNRYMVFAIYVVGVSGGVRIWDLEKYITGRGPDEIPIVLNGERWVLEVYRALISTLQGTAWMLLVFFVFSLIAYVIMKGFELRRSRSKPSGAPPSD